MANGRGRNAKVCFRFDVELATDSADHGKVVDSVADQKLQLTSESRGLPVSVVDSAVHFHQKTDGRRIGEDFGKLFAHFGGLSGGAGGLGFEGGQAHALVVIDFSLGKPVEEGIVVIEAMAHMAPDGRTVECGGLVTEGFIIQLN